MDQYVRRFICASLVWLAARDGAPLDELLRALEGAER
jgi:hypothetical protein